MEAIFPDAKYRNNASLQCYDLSNLSTLAALTLQFPGRQAVAAPLAVRVLYVRCADRTLRPSVTAIGFLLDNACSVFWK